MAITDALKADLEGYFQAVKDYELKVAAAIVAAQQAASGDAMAAIDALDAEVKAAGQELAAASAALNPPTG